MGSPLSVPSGPSKVSDLRFLDYRRVHVTPCLVIHSWNILLNILWRLLTNAFTIWWIIGVLVAEVHNQVTANLVPSPSLGGRYLPCGRCFCIRPIAVCLLLFFFDVLDVLLDTFEVGPPMSVAALLCRCRARQGPDPACQRRSSVDHDPVPTEAEN
jgi:hypothetical protein